MKKILVTGGAGFIGSHLIEKLLKRGDKVICLDNMYTGQKKNVIKFMDNPYFEFMQQNVEKPVLIQVDEIFNLACPASPVHYQNQPINTVKTSFLGALNMLELAKENNARILQASTSEVYGDPDVHPQTEDYWGHVNPNGIRSCYDEGKRVAETLFMDYYRVYKTDIRLIRIFNTYGPRMLENDGRVVSNFIVQALKGKDISVYGDGLQTRSFCYVDDLVDGMLKMMSKDDFTGPVNLGNPDEFTIMELAEMVIEQTKSDSKIIKLPLPADDPKRRKPDITLAKNTLNWEPSVPLKTGLARTIDYFKNEIK